MPLQSSGAISLHEMHIEAGGASGTNCTINDSDIRGLVGASSGAEMSCEIILPLLKNSSSFQDAGTWQAWNGSGTNRVSIGLCGNGGGEQNKTWFYIQANQLNDDTVTSEWRTCFTYLLA